MPDREFSRRRLLAGLSTAGITAIAGCNSGGTESTPNPTQTPTPTASPTATDSQTPTETEEPTPTPRENPDTIFVSPDGDDDDAGTEGAPLASIRQAVTSANPGQTVYVQPGEYFEFVPFDEPGEPDAPITLTGPPDAVLRPPDDIDYGMISITADYIHITGLTMSGRYKDRDPGKPDSYVPSHLIDLNTSPEDADDYLEGLVISPHGLGESGGALINSQQIKDCDIGGFKVTGPAGAEWLYDDDYANHYGEIVYLGTAPDNRVERGYEDYDRTRNIRVHHIDNSEGYPHSELVDCKTGVENITIEYCTDAGGAQADDSWNQPAIKLDGNDVTIRWNIINGVQGDGIQIGPGVYMSGFTNDGEPIYEYGLDSVPETDFERQMGKDNTIHENVITSCERDAVNFRRQSRRPGRDSNPSPADQRVLCGNQYDGYTDGEPGKPCPTELASSKGIGHLAGDSPWDGDPPSIDQAFSKHESIAQFDVTVGKDAVTTSEEFEIPVTVTNNGTDSEEITLSLMINQHELSSKTVTVDPNHQQDVTLTEMLGNEDEIQIMMNGLKVGSVQLSHDT